MTKIGVVIPLYNQGMYLKEALDSVALNKLYPDMEVHVCIVDDKSTDDSLTVASNLVSGYSDKFKSITVVGHTENKGVSAARNFGIKSLPEAEYIICLDADDKLAENYIKRNYNNIRLNGYDVSYADSRCFGEKHVIYKWPKFNVDLLRTGNYINCSAMMRRKVWEDTEGFDEQMLKGNEDYEFWLRASKNFSFEKCEGTHLFYRIKTGSRDDMVNRTHKAEIDKYIKNKHGDWYLVGV